MNLTITHFTLFPPFRPFPFLVLAFDFGFDLGFVLLLLGLEASFSFLDSLTFLIFFDFDDFLDSIFLTSDVSETFCFEFDLGFFD